MASILSQHALITGPPGVGKTTLIRKVCAALVDKHHVDVQGFYTEEVRGDSGRPGGRGPRIGFDVVTMDGTRAPLARVQRDGASGSRGSQGVCSRASEGAGPRGSSRYMVGKYCVDVDSFETVALPALQWATGSTKDRGKESGRCLEGGGVNNDCGRERGDGEDGPKVMAACREEGRGGRGIQVLVIDEIGKMELFSRNFVDRVSTLFIDSPKEKAVSTPGGSAVVFLATIPVTRPHGKEHRLLQEIRHREDCMLFQVTEANRNSLLDDILTFILQILSRTK